jgi:hypothetical protein
MSDLMYYLKMPLEWLSFGDWSNPSQLMLVVLLFANLGTYGLCRIVSGPKTITAPICFWVLLASGVAANRLLHGFRLPSTNELQHTIIFTTAGMIVGSMVLLTALRVQSRGEK